MPASACPCSPSPCSGCCRSRPAGCCCASGAGPAPPCSSPLAPAAASTAAHHCSACSPHPPCPRRKQGRTRAREGKERRLRCLWWLSMGSMSWRGLAGASGRRTGCGGSSSCGSRRQCRRLQASSSACSQADLRQRRSKAWARSCVGGRLQQAHLKVLLALTPGPAVPEPWMAPVQVPVRAPMVPLQVPPLGLCLRQDGTWRTDGKQVARCWEGWQQRRQGRGWEIEEEF